MEKINFPEGLDKLILELLMWRRGENNAIARGELLAACQGKQACGDSQLRLAIQSLRAQGNLICNNMNGDGYYLPENKEEYDRFIVQYVSKAATVMEIAKRMNKTAASRWDYNPDQPKLL